jgi:hypothetical protein
VPEALLIAGVENSSAAPGNIASLEGMEYGSGCGVFEMAVGASARERSDGVPYQNCSDGIGAGETLTGSGFVDTATGPVSFCAISKCCPQILQNLASSGLSEPQWIQYMVGLFLSELVK